MKSLSFLLPLFLLTSAAVSAEAPKEFKVSELTFKRPANWEWVETSSSMRKAQLKVPAESGADPGEVVFFHFGEGGAGGTKANVDRWLSQFNEPRNETNTKVEETTVGKRKVTYVQADGTYMSGMPGGPKKSLAGHTLLGAIIEADQGSVFIRFTGPTPLAKASRETFRGMVGSALSP